MKLAGFFLVCALMAGCVPVFAPPGPPVEAPVIGPGSFTARDGTVLPLRHWDAREPRAVIVALHGMSDYSRAFAMPGPWWAARGITTYAYDQRGFGAGPDPGRWAGGDALRADLKDFTEALHAKYPGLPVYALGESMGGAVLLSALGSADPPRLDGAILVAPAVWSRRDMPFSYRAALWLAAHLAPGLDLSGNGLGIVPSDNRAMLLELSRDPLFQKRTRADAVYGLVDLMDEGRAAASHLMHPPPILFLYGARDQIIPAQASAAAIAALGPRVQVRRYEQGYHMLLRDLEGEKVWREIADWILPAR